MEHRWTVRDGAARRLRAAPRRAVHAVAPRVAGGPAQARVVLLLACVLGLNGADFGTVSAITDVLTDRVRRTRLLAGSIAVWSVALVFSGAATSYLWLLLARLALGVASATTGPTVSSLVGDFFPAAQRSGMYGLIRGGELAATGIGFVVSGEIAGILPWRYTFWWLVLPGLALAMAIHRLPEPARGGQRRLDTGADDVSDVSDADPAPQRDLAAYAVRHAGVEPQPELVLRTDPARRSLWWAVGYVLRIRTNVIIIVASAMGYFFFSGLRSVAIIYVIGHYGLSKSVASPLVLIVDIGAVSGVLAGGRIADRALARGHIRARVVVPATCMFLAPLVLAPALMTTSVAVALPLLVLGAALLGAPNPPMDAARLDIIHPRLWGRAEAVRTVLRSLAEAAAPTAFGFASQRVFGGSTGLECTFLLGLIPLLAAGTLILPALRTYPRDVATASASARATTGGRSEG